MKHYRVLFFVVVIQSTIACKKETKLFDACSVTVVNAIVGSNPIITDFNQVHPIATYYATATQINYSSFYQFSMRSGSYSFVAYQTTDTLTSIYNVANHEKEFDFLPKGIYTIFLCGQVTPILKSEAVIVSENIPAYSSTDSVMGIRFINLSPGSDPVNVTLSTSTNINEVSNLVYKNISIFKSYSTTAAINSYTFQFRDPITNSIITSITLSGINNGTGSNTSSNNYRFRNFTLVLKGISGGLGSNAQSAFLVNHY
jgi:hypothetical protein